MGDDMVESDVPKRLVLLLTASGQIRRSVAQALKSHRLPVRAISRPSELWNDDMPTPPACLLCEHAPSRGIDATEIMQGIEERMWLLPTVVLASEWTLPEVDRTMKAGAETLIPTGGDMAGLSAAIDAALVSAATQAEWHQVAVDSKSRMATLNDRERDIVKLMLHGMLNKEIAERLDLALVTVKVHRSRAMKKLGVQNPTQIGKIACLAGVFKLNPAFWRRI